MGTKKLISLVSGLKRGSLQGCSKTAGGSSRSKTEMTPLALLQNCRGKGTGFGREALHQASCLEQHEDSLEKSNVGRKDDSLVGDVPDCLELCGGWQPEQGPWSLRLSW